MNYEEYEKFEFSKNLRFLVSKIDDLEKKFLKLKDINISQRELDYIALIAENKNKPFTELIKLDSVSKSTFSNQVKLLRKKELIVYKKFNDNKKTKHLELTKQGFKIYQSYKEIRKFIFNQFVKDKFTDNEIKNVFEISNKLLDEIKQYYFEESK